MAVPAFAQQTHLLVITGVPGDEEHAQQFQKWATSFIDAAKKKDGVPDANITYLADKQSTRVGVEKAFADLAARVKPNDGVFVLLIGHGSFNGTQAAFNLPGPDLTVADWAKLLGKLSDAARGVRQHDQLERRVPAGGRGAGTRGRHRDEDRRRAQRDAVPRVLRRGVQRRGSGPRSQRPRVGRRSVRVREDEGDVQAFQQKGLLLTEHATMDDGAGGDGRLAATIFLGTGRAEGALAVDTNDPAMRALVAERDAIDQQIAALKLKKNTMDEAQYDAQMEKLLTDLALKTKAIRDLQAKKDKP